MKALDQFDLVTVLEMSDSSALWEAKYGMKIEHSNGCGKYKGVYAAERRKDKKFDRKWKEFEQEFEALNRVDYLLYGHANELHRGFALQLNT